MADMRIRNTAGFTLIEIITVLLVISIVSAVIVNRLMDTSVELIAQTDVIKTHLRYAQSRAMSSNVKWGIVFQGSTYSLFKNENTGDTVFLPGENSKTLNLPSGINFTSIVAFDSWGKPYNDAGGSSAHPGGQVGNLAIIITKNTGFIE
jgi:MSHA pilin protein MshC